MGTTEYESYHLYCLWISRDVDDISIRIIIEFYYKLQSKWKIPYRHDDTVLGQILQQICCQHHVVHIPYRLYCDCSFSILVVETITIHICDDWLIEKVEKAIIELRKTTIKRSPIYGLLKIGVRCQSTLRFSMRVVSS